jgi:hypothetical protein
VHAFRCLVDFPFDSRDAIWGCVTIQRVKSASGGELSIAVQITGDGRSGVKSTEVHAIFRTIGGAQGRLSLPLMMQVQVLQQPCSPLVQTHSRACQGGGYTAQGRDKCGGM